MERDEKHTLPPPLFRLAWRPLVTDLDNEVALADTVALLDEDALDLAGYGSGNVALHLHRTQNTDQGQRSQYKDV